MTDKPIKLEDQVCSLELAKRLRDLGVKQESLFKWNVPRPTQEEIEDKIFFEDEINPKIYTEEQWEKYAEDYIPPQSEMYSAFTVAELGEMLPYDTLSGKSGFIAPKQYICTSYKPSKAEYADTEANVRAKMLIYLIENDLIEKGKSK